MLAGTLSAVRLDEAAATGNIVPDILLARLVVVRGLDFDAAADVDHLSSMSGGAGKLTQLLSLVADILAMRTLPREFSLESLQRRAVGRGNGWAVVHVQKRWLSLKLPASVRAR